MNQAKRNLLKIFGQATAMLAPFRIANSQQTSNTNDDSPITNNELNFIYAEKSHIHAPGTLIGTGSTADPIQIAVTSHQNVTLEDIKPNAGDGTDDTVALYSAIDKALKHRTRVQLLGKTYNFDQPILIDANRETLMLEGQGTESKRFDPPPYSTGSVLNSRILDGNAFTFKGVQTQIRDLTFAGITRNWVLVSELHQFTSVKNIHIDAAGADTNGLRVDKSFTNVFEGIDIYKRHRNKVGIGLWHNTTNDIAGGNTLFTNITASFFKHNLEFGQIEPYGGKQKDRNHTLINVQGRYGETGIRFGSGYGRTEVINAWAEWNDYAQIQVHSGAGPIWFRGCELAAVKTGYGLVLGLDPATNENPPIYPVTVQNTQVRAWKNFAAVRIFPPTTQPFPNSWHEFDNIEFWNNGGSRFLTEPSLQLPILLKRAIYNDPREYWKAKNAMQFLDKKRRVKNFKPDQENPLISGEPQ